jgi:hypothetical protein
VDVFGGDDGVGAHVSHTSERRKTEVAPHARVADD